MRTGSPIIIQKMLSLLRYAFLCCLTGGEKGGGRRGEKVKKPAFFFLGGIREEQVKHKVFMQQEPHTVARHREFLID